LISETHVWREAVHGQFLVRRGAPGLSFSPGNRKGGASPLPRHRHGRRGAETGCTNQTTGEKKMGITELFLVGVGLSMDAFAVAICRGLSMKKLEWKQALLVAVFFGGFQALMPTIGWVLGKQFEQYIV